MVAFDLIQGAIVSKLKANVALLAYLTARSASQEVRETNWQGTEFTYPAVRANGRNMTPEGNAECRENHTLVAFEVHALSEQDSSQECMELAALVVDALFGKQLSGTGFKTGTINCLASAPPVRASLRVWRSTSQFQVRVYET